MSAGHELYDVNTDEYHHPYNQAVVKPFHILWTDSATLKNDIMNEVKDFNSSIVNYPDTVSISCIYGRDGVNDTDWTITAENDNCNEFGVVMDQKLEDLRMAPFMSESQTGKSDMDILKWIVAAVVAAVWLCVWGRAIYKHGVDRSKSMEMLSMGTSYEYNPIDSIMETDPLLKVHNKDMARNPLLQ